MFGRHAFDQQAPGASESDFGFVPAAPLRVVRQPAPSADAFALGFSVHPIARVWPGETVAVEVGGETTASGWCAARVSSVPVVTGPIFVEEAEAGDVLVVSVVSIEALALASAGSPLAVAIATAGDHPRHAGAGITACLAVRQPGALVTLGPVRARADGAPVAALVVVTISVWSGERDERP